MVDSVLAAKSIDRSLLPDSVFDGPVMVSIGRDSEEGNSAMRKPLGLGISPAETAKYLSANDNTYALAA